MINKVSKILSRHLLILASVFVLFGSKSAFADILSPGIITTCGEIVTTGTYTLGNDISTSSGTCLTITSGGASASTTVDGYGYTIRGDVFADGISSSTPGHNFTLQNITVVGNVTSNGGYGANGGNIVTSSSTINTISVSGGAGAYGGSVTITNTNIDLTHLDLSMSGGSLTLNYINLIHTNFAFPALANLTLNGPGNLPGNLGAFGGGVLSFPGDVITNANQCNLAIAGTTTLGSDITGNCVITGNGGDS